MRRRPGALEQEVVAALAAAGRDLTAAQVQQSLGPELAYTTVMTTLTRLWEKGVLSRVADGRAYRYELVGSPTTVQAALTARQMRRLMAGHHDKAAVMSRFVDDLSSEEADLLAQALAQTLDQPSGDPARVTPQERV